MDRAPGTGETEMTIDMSSISSGVADFDGHLKSADFFNTEEHPNAKFVGKKFNFDGDTLKSVEGELTLLGKTNPVTL